MARLLAVLDHLPGWSCARQASGEVAEWLKAADCKSARASVRWFESSPLHHILKAAFTQFSSIPEKNTENLAKPVAMP